MARVPSRWFGREDDEHEERKPSLTIDTLGGVEVAVLTVARVNADIVMGGKPRGFIEFREVPTHVWWFGIEDMRVLSVHLGRDTDAWIDKRVPLMKTRVLNPKTEEFVVKYRCAPTSRQWKQAIEEHDARLAQSSMLPEERQRVVRKRRGK